MQYHAVMRQHLSECALLRRYERGFDSPEELAGLSVASAVAEACSKQEKTMKKHFFGPQCADMQRMVERALDIVRMLIRYHLDSV